MDATGPRPITETRTVEVVIGWEITCQRCQQRFQAKRRDALYCSDRCRMAAHREAQGRGR